MPPRRGWVPVTLTRSNDVPIRSDVIREESPSSGMTANGKYTRTSGADEREAAALLDRLEAAHEAGVLVQLGGRGHAGEHAHHVVQRGGVANCQLGGRGVREAARQLASRRVRQIGERTALDGIHHHDGLAVRRRHVVAPAALDRGARPVQPEVFTLCAR